MKVSSESLWFTDIINGKEHFFTEENFLKHSWSTTLKLKEKLTKNCVSPGKDNTNFAPVGVNNNNADKTISLQNKEPSDNKKEENGPFSKPYWPFPRSPVPYPKNSSLKKNEHLLYIKLNEKKVKNITLSNKEKEIFQRLQTLVKKEREEFTLFAKGVAEKFHDVYNHIHPEADIYTKELIKNHYLRVYHYPRYYSLETEISLVAKETCPNLQLLKTLLQLGEIPRVLLPTLKMKTTVPLNYQKVYDRYPIRDKLPEHNEKFLYKKVVSKDPNAEELAVKYKAAIVISSSSIKTICDNLAENSSTFWEIPVVVKECKEGENVWKAVFVDKTLPPKGMPAYKRNEWYHKFALKRALIHPKFGKIQPGNYLKCEKELPKVPQQIPRDDDCFDSEDISHLETFGNEIVSSADCQQRSSPSSSRTQHNTSNVESEFQDPEKNNTSNANRNNGNLGQTSDVYPQVDMQKCLKNINQQSPDFQDGDNNSSNNAYKEFSVATFESNQSDSDSDALVIDISLSPKKETNAEERKTNSLEKSIMNHISTENVHNSKCNSGSAVSGPMPFVAFSDIPKIDSNRTKESEDVRAHQVLPSNIPNKTSCIMTRSKTQSILRDTNKNEQHNDITMKNSNAFEDKNGTLLHEVFGESSSDDEPKNKQQFQIRKRKCTGNTKANSKMVKVNEEIISNNNDENPLDAILAMQEKTLKTTKTTTNHTPYRNKLEHPNSASNQYEILKQKNGIEDSKNFLPPPNEKNLTYRLWSLEDLTLLIRCSIDGKIPSATTSCQSENFCKLFPKMEYQCAYGGEIVTESEYIRQWISSKIRLNCKTIRVRINSTNSEIMAVEEIDFKDPFPIIERKALCALYEILSFLNKLTPAHYILRRTGEDPILKLYKHTDSSKRGDWDLHTSFNYFLEEAPAPVKQVPWLPIDSSILFRHHKILSWIPGTFDVQSGHSKNKKNQKQKSQKKKSQKKKKKK